MKSNNLTLGEILAYPSQYVIPVFQRYYRWDQPQWEKLWGDLAGLREPGKTGRHFMGFLVLVPESVGPGQIARFHLIDGQQRLTTLSLVLCALRNAARAAGHEELALEVEVSSLVHQFKKGEQKYRVYPKLRDREQYVACVDGEPPTEGRIGAAVRYFVGRLATIPDAGTDAGLRAFYDLLRQRLEFVYAQLEGENAYNIFKSLNSTGVPLGQADLIRNFVFMQVPVADQDEFDAKSWGPMERRFEDAEGKLDGEQFSAFLRDHLMRDGAYIPPGATFEAFQRRYSATGFDPMAVADGLKRASGWYASILGGEEDPSPEVEAALSALRQSDSSTTHALLLNLFHRRHAGTLTDADLAAALRLISGFILRRLVCGEGSRAYSRLFVQACSELGEAPVEGLRRYLESRGFPDTPRFVEAFARFNLYGSRYGKAVLAALERAQEHKEPADPGPAQIEHVMPQTLSGPWRDALGPEAEEIHATWLHTPGNLTLTGYNQELHNHPFAAKREEYKESHFVLTRLLADHETWGEAEIRQRGHELAELAARIWPGPAAPVRRIEEPAGTAPGRFDIRLRYWTGFRDFLNAAGSPLDLQEPTTSYNLRCGRLGPGVVLIAYLQLKNSRLAVSACFYGKKGNALFEDLKEHRDAIEAELGAPLDWTATPGGSYREILLHNPIDPTDEVLWPSDFDWMRRTLETLHRVVGSHIEKSGPAQGAEAKDSLYLDYWTAFRDRLLQAGGDLKPRKPRPEGWMHFSVGRSDAVLIALASRRDRWIGSELILYGDSGRASYEAMEVDGAAIEQEFGEPLEWRGQPGGKHSKIRIRRMGVEPSNRKDWTEQHQWLQAKLERLYAVLVPRLGSSGQAEVNSDLEDRTGPA